MLGKLQCVLKPRISHLKHTCMSTIDVQSDSFKTDLEIKNPHHFDRKISKGPNESLFRFDGAPLKYTVPNIVDNFFPKFDADSTIAKMMAKDNWPTPLYQRKDGSPYTALGIKRKWSDGRLYNEKMSLEMNKNFERYVNNLATSECVEVTAFEIFYHQFITEQEIEPYRTEWQIAAAAKGITGVVNFLGKFNDGTYALVDWDRSKGLKSQMTNPFGLCAEAPITHIVDCSASKCFLALNLKRHILEEYYGIPVSYMAVVNFHRENEEGFSLIKAPLWAGESTALIDAVAASGLQKPRS